MQKKTLTIRVSAFLRIAVIVAAGATAAVAQQGPRLSLDATEADLGDKLCYREFDHVFTLRNTGDAPLEIALEKKSCGCTSNMLSTNVIPPASSAEVSVGFAPKKDKKRVGKNQFSVQLSTNDPANKTVVLAVKANLMDQVQVEPPQIQLAAISLASADAAAATATPFSILCLDDEGFPEVSVKCDVPNLAIEQRDVKKTATTVVHNYAVRLVPPVLKSSVEYIHVETTSPRVPSLEIPVQIDTAPPVDIKPSRILFGIIKSGQPLEKEAAVRVAGDAGDLSCKCADSARARGVAAALEPVSKGQWKLRVSIRALPITKVEQINTEVKIVDAAGNCVVVVPVMATLLP